MTGYELTENSKHENVKNITTQREFYLNAILFSEKSQIVVFIGAFFVYLLAMFGNLTVSLLICLVTQLHKPMYFFLCCLSVQDIVFVSTILPKLMAITVTGDTSISFSHCIAQFFLFGMCVNVEIFLLTSMAYDRYIAICIPLRYSLIMNKKVCSLLATMSWLAGFLNSVIFSSLISHLSFCDLRTINHFFCDPQTMLTLSCSDTKTIKVIIYVEAIILGILPLIMILISYTNIISSILKIHISKGRLKTFSSCSSHLTVVILYYSTSLSMNVLPKSKHFSDLDKLFSLLYTAVVPMLNPLVYSLKNKDVVNAFKTSGLRFN